MSKLLSFRKDFSKETIVCCELHFELSECRKQLALVMCTSRFEAQRVMLLKATELVSEYHYQVRVKRIDYGFAVKVMIGDKPLMDFSEELLFIADSDAAATGLFIALTHIINRMDETFLNLPTHEA